MDGVKKFAKDVKTVARRKSVVDRLEKQLKVGFKPEKGGKKNIPLNDSDIKRIKKELETLKARLV